MLFSVLQIVSMFSSILISCLLSWVNPFGLQDGFNIKAAAWFHFYGLVTELFGAITLGSLARQYCNFRELFKF